MSFPKGNDMDNEDKYGRADFQRDTQEAPRVIWRIFTRVLLPIMGICLLVGACVWGLKILTAPAGVVERMADPDNAIYNIEWFRTQSGQIEAIRRQTTTAQAALDDFTKTNGAASSYTYAQNAEHSRLVANVTGIKNQCETMAADYNAKSKMVTRSIFKGSDLPMEVSCQ